MSEGAPLFGWQAEESVTVSSKGNIPGLGRDMPGTTVRICESGHDNTVVSRHTIGDLEVNSTGLVNRYLGNEHTNSAFLEGEAGRRWFKAVDLAYMDDSGVIFIIGRSKDIIKYKGVGIVPSIVEVCLEKAYHDGVQVVGIPDAAYGAKAIPVVKGVRTDGSSNTRQEMKQHVLLSLGPEYMMGAILFLPDLQFSDWPKNSSHKIVKKDLVDVIEQRRVSLGL